MRENQEKQHNVKFTANDEEYRKLSALASVRHMTVPQFCKLTALGVRSTPAKQVIIEQKIMFEENKVESETKEELPAQIEQVEVMVKQLSEEDLLFVKELKGRIKVDSNFFDYRGGFLKKLNEFATRMEALGENGSVE